MNTKKLLTQNSKMKATMKLHPGIRLYDFALPAIKTCPRAGECKRYCYAQQGRACFKKTKQAKEERYTASQASDFTWRMIDEILKCRATHIRIHSSGDFYDANYIFKWKSIICACSDVQFYAYTKSIDLIEPLKYWPDNVTFILSYGGVGDASIGNRRNARVFANLTDLLSAGYVDCGHDDLIALNSDNHNIGLVYHGIKKFNR